MPGGEEISFERITQIYREERARKTLFPFEPDFYDKLKEYLSRLEKALREEDRKDPNSPKALVLRDEYRKVQKKREQIYQYRERKIVALASSKASGAEIDMKPLTKQELDLFQKLVSCLVETREKVFVFEKRMEEKVQEVEEKLQFEKLGEVVLEEKKTPIPEKDFVVVRVLEDIPTFAGINATYKLKKEDVVTLPRSIAKVLCDRGKAKEVQVIGKS